MAYIKMTPAQMSRMYLFNCQRREILLNEAMKKNTPVERLKFVVDYFVDKLDQSAIAQIDGCTEKSVIPYKYDYSFLEDFGTWSVREPEIRKWEYGSYGYSLPQVDNDIRDEEKIRIYPAVYALKMGTCIMFASEIQRFARDFGLDSCIVQKMDYCYDKFDGFSIDHKPIQTDRIIKMQHFYNIVSIDGVKYKIDIAGYLTAKDLNNSHPELSVDPEDFYFSPTTEKNPIAQVIDLAGQDFVNLTNQNQPQ